MDAQKHLNTQRSTHSFEILLQTIEVVDSMTGRWRMRQTLKTSFVLHFTTIMEYKMKVDEPSLSMDHYHLILEPCCELVCRVFGKQYVKGKNNFVSVHSKSYLFRFWADYARCFKCVTLTERQKTALLNFNASVNFIKGNSKVSSSFVSTLLQVNNYTCIKLIFRLALHS